MMVRVMLAVERSTWCCKEDAGMRLGRILNAAVGQGRCFEQAIAAKKLGEEEEEEEEEVA